MKRISIVIIAILLIVAYFLWTKQNLKDEKPIEAQVMVVNTKLDGTGYVIVLRSAGDPNVWVTAFVTEIVKQWDIVTVDRANGIIFYNGGKEGMILKK